MRILRLELSAFGPFTDVCLDFDRGNSGLHLIYGPNEAGKSSALRALRQFFYGIDPRTADNFVHAYPSLRIGAVLRDAQGQTRHFIRRKGNKDTLRGPDDREVIEPARLNELLGGVDEQDFRRRFGIDYQELVVGGQDIVCGGGNLGGMLFAAGAGLSGLNAIQKQLTDDAEQLFKPQGSLPRINRALSDLKEARRQRKEAALRPAIWSQHQQTLQEAESEQTEIAGQLLEKCAQRQRLDRFRQAVPLIDKRRHLLEQLQQLGDVPRLAEDFCEQRREAAFALDAATGVWKQAGETLAEIGTAIASLHISEPLLEKAASIQRLRDPLGAVRKAACDRPTLVAQREHLHKEARAILIDLGRSGDLDEIQRLELDRGRRQQIKRLANQREALTNRLETGGERVQALRRDAEHKSRQLECLAAACDPAELRRVLRRAAAEGDLEARREELCTQLHQSEQQAELCLARLGLWTGCFEDLERLAIPGRETIERLETQQRGDEARVEACNQRRQALEHEIARRTAEIEELRQQQDALTEEDLLARRGDRDAGWQLVLAAWKGEPPAEAAVADFVASCSPAEDLAQAYAVSVQRADLAADRLRREADQVARKAHLIAELQAAQRQRDEILKQHSEAAQCLAATGQQWRDLWSPLGIDPLPPREMLAWVARHCDLLRSAGEIRGLRGELDDLQRRIATRRQELAGALHRLGHGPDPAETDRQLTLADLHDHAEQVAQQLDDLANQRRQLEHELEQLGQQLPEATDQRDQAATQLEKWQEQWSEAMSWLELAADANPDDAVDFTDTLQDLVARWKKCDDLSRRIADIDRDAEQFACQVAELTCELADDLVDQPAEVAADALLQRLADSRAAHARLQQLAEQQQREQTRHREAADKIAAMTRRLNALCQEARCAAPDELPAVERRSAERREAEQERKRVEDRVLELAAGSPLEQFIQEAAACEADQLEPSIRQIDEDIERLQQRKDALKDTIAHERVELKNMDGSAAAADADEQAQSLLAQIGADAEDYVRLRMASTILQQAIERYREKNQDPVLQRASGLFADLTLGSFSALREDYDDKGEAILLGVRSDGRSAVTVEGMSDGSRDQLYLALRLASLEHFLTQNSPLPFIVDDVLIQFDDHRAAAALRAFGGLSERTQVLFFTHHEHLVSLAEQHVESHRLFVHRLPALEETPVQKTS